MGIGEYIDGGSNSFIMFVNRETKCLQFGATDKAMKIIYTDDITEEIPFVGVGSRNATEVHAVINGKVCAYSGEIKEPYATNPYDMQNALGVSYSSTLGNVCSFAFFCKDYMMTEEELLVVNKIFYDLMEALW